MPEPDAVPTAPRAPVSVSVVLPVRNGEQFVRAAIDSILGQSHRDLELVVVENGSTDTTPSILADIAASDARVVVVHAGEIGLVASLNLGIRTARGEFIARMDADDIAHPDRLRLQLAAMRDDPTLVALGTRYRYIDAAGTPLGERRTPLRPDAVAAALHFGNPIAHPSVMLAPSRIARPVEYSANAPDAEDFELWVRLSARGRLGNLDDVLLDRRVHPDSIGAKPDSGRASSIDVLVAASPWPVTVSRWVHARTFNAHQGGVGTVAFIAAVAVLNACTLARPMAPRRAVAARSTLAIGSFVQRRIRRLKSRRRRR